MSWVIIVGLGLDSGRAVRQGLRRLADLSLCTALAAFWRRHVRGPDSPCSLELLGLLLFGCWYCLLSGGYWWSSALCYGGFRCCWGLPAFQWPPHLLRRLHLSWALRRCRLCDKWSELCCLLCWYCCWLSGHSLVRRLWSHCWLWLDHHLPMYEHWMHRACCFRSHFWGLGCKMG